ncbi:MAG: hypothetical protein MUC86_05670 [Burkholderiaceae bacterium]|nr:hypothetical protein [Burkholderiaceae bacterium]
MSAISAAMSSVRAASTVASGSFGVDVEPALLVAAAATAFVAVGAMATTPG